MKRSLAHSGQRVLVNRGDGQERIGGGSSGQCGSELLSRRMRGSEHTRTGNPRGGRMRANGLIVGSVALFPASAVLVAAGQSASQNSPSTPSAQALPQQQAQSHGASLKVRTRLVTVDVVATDSHGNVVRDLKPEELEISDGGGPQRIARFSFVDKSADSGATKLSTAAQTRPKGFYTNQAAVERLTTPPTVILLDALNTEGTDLLQ